MQKSEMETLVRRLTLAEVGDLIQVVRTNVNAVRRDLISGLPREEYAKAGVPIAGVHKPATSPASVLTSEHGNAGVIADETEIGIL